MTALDAMRIVLDREICTTVHDADEILNELERLGFVLVQTEMSRAARDDEMY